MIRLIVDLPEGSTVATSREVPHCQCVDNFGLVHYHLQLSGIRLVGADLVEVAKLLARTLGTQYSFEFGTPEGPMRTPPRAD
jgi:hypothetical protein